MKKYYNWQKTQSFNAKFNMVITMRGYGKTYGLRKFCVKDYIKNKKKFACIVRFKTKLIGKDSVQNGFFEKLEFNNEFPDYIFKTEGAMAYISKKPENEKIKPKWELIGYFLALTDMQNTKERTFVNINTVIFDEFIIDKRTKRNYLAGEFDLFVNTLDSLFREENGNITDGHVYLLGNSCDLSNPYFARFNIYKEPREGFNWFNNKLVLLHYCKDEIWSEKKKNTLIGQLVKGTKEENIIINNEFANSNNDFIEQKTKNSKFIYGIIYLNENYGVWIDEQNYIIYICDKLVKNNGNIYTFTTSDNKINYNMVKKSDRLLQSLVEMYYKGILRFDNNYIYERFLNILKLFGVL